MPRQPKKTTKRTKSDPVSIIGLSIRLPGCDSMYDFWKRLLLGNSLMNGMSKERWERMQSGIAAWGSREAIRGMFMEDVDAFDGKLFKLSKGACIFTDPRQRLLLESCWGAIEDAGLKVSDLRKQKVGVFIANDGFTFGSYFRGVSESDLDYQEFVIPGNATSFLANRISYLLDFQGPSMVVDSTCSSIYVALHHARLALERGECDYALVGGITLFLEPWKPGQVSPTFFESPSGEVISFSSMADGYISSEGCGALLLQKSDAALTQGHSSYADLTGSSYNSGGKTGSFAQPSQEQLIAVFQETLASAGIDPLDIDYIEAHGISSALGDTLEANAIIDVFGRKENACYVSSIKPNIGHTHAASGIYSLLKSVLALKYRKIPAIRGLKGSGLNEEIPSDTRGITFLTKTMDWPQASSKNDTRHVLLNSYGFSNVNAAIIVSEAPAVAQNKKEYRFGDKAIICLSARTKEQVYTQMEKLLSFIKERKQLSKKRLEKAVDCYELAYTLQLGRESMACRWAALVSSVAQLERVLTRELKGQEKDQNTFWSDTAEDPALEHPDKEVSKTISSRDSRRIAMLWAAGIRINWEDCYGGKTLRKIHAPAYPFARERYWLSEQKGSGKATTKLHSFLHVNESDLNSQKFSTLFTGEEDFLVDHEVSGKRIFPGAAYLELVREAGTRSTNQKITQIKDLIWLTPKWGMGEPKPLYTALSPLEGEIKFEVYSLDRDEKSLHSQGSLSVKEIASFPENYDIAAIKSRMKGEIDKTQWYGSMVELGLVLGKCYTGVTRFYHNEKEVLTEINFPKEPDYVLSVGIMDSTLQTCVGWLLEREQYLALPFGVREVTIYRDIPEGTLWAYATKSKNNKPNSQITNYNVDLMNDSGEVILGFKDFVIRSFVGEESRRYGVRSEETSTVPGGEEMTSELKQASGAYIKALIAKELKIPESDLEFKASFENYGIDSVLVNRLTNKLEEKFGRLNRTLFFEYQTLGALVDYFIEEHAATLYQLTEPGKTPSEAPKNIFGDEAASTEYRPAQRFLPSQRPTQPYEQSAENGTIAIIGMSGRYPGAKNINAFWENLKAGKNSITEIPNDRWDMEDFYDAEKGKTARSYSKWGGFIEDVDKFDPLFFNISPKEAPLMDPQERLFLQTVWETIEDAGYTRAQLQGRNTGKKGFGYKTGIYVGVMFQDYSLLAPEQSRSGNAVPDGITGNVANRVSYFFNFYGPSITVDTMCSSSLTAIHLACQGLQAGDAQLAIAGGVNVSVHPNKYLMLCQKRFLSSEGRCTSFGEGGDGYVPGEGVGALLLKPLQAAKADGDRIYGVIKGTSLNHGGKTNGYTVPNPVAQTALIRETIEKSGVKPEDFSYIEAHGTGTPLGDPIEITGLTKAFRSEKKQYCAIGSVKSNIGHTESAAGVSGVTKVLLQMQHRQLVPSLHASALNPHIDFEHTPFKVQQELADWTTEDNKPRIAGVSSFGAGGSNAHVILEEFSIQHDEFTSKEEPAIIVLSAKNEERLKEHAANLTTYLKANSQVNLHAVAYTLQAGREAMEERLAFISNNVDEAIDRLNKYLGENKEGLITGNIKKDKKATDVLFSGAEGQEYLTKIFEKKDHQKIAQLWVTGITIDWALLYPAEKPRKISLPSYPFARERYWLPETPGTATGFPGTEAISFEFSAPEQQDSIADKEALRQIQKPPENNGQLRVSAKGTSNGAQVQERVYFTSRWEPSALSELPERSSKPAHGISVFVAAGTTTGIVKKLKMLAIPDPVFQLPTSEDPAKQVQDATLQLLEYCKKLIKSRKNSTEKLLVYVPYKSTVFPYKSLMGLLRSVSLESPFLKTKLLFDAALDSGDVDLAGKHLSDEIAFWDDFSEVMYDQNQARLVLRQKQIPVDGFDTSSPEFRNEGIYLITGGLGSLGRIFARFIGNATNAHLILTGRSPLTPEKESLLSGLSSEGIRVHYIPCDINSKTATQQMVDDVVGKFGTIHGVIHSAGSIRDNYCVNKTAEEMLEVLSPKVTAVMNLDEATGSLPLDFFVLFSSVAALGSAGQTDYATGNAFMDVFAQQRQDMVAKGMRKGKSISVNWPLWKDGGMNPGEPYEEALLKKMGMRPLEKALGIEAFTKALASEEHQLGILSGNTQKILRFLKIQTNGQDTQAIKQHITKDAVRAFVLEEVSKIIGLKKSGIDPGASLIDYGVDSIGLLELAEVLNAAYKSNYTGAAFMELSTVEQIVTHLYEHGDLQEVRMHSETHQPVKPPVSWQENGSETYELPADQHIDFPKTQLQDQHRLAIIGYDCKFPGAETPEAFWDNISNNVISVKNIRQDDWEKRGVVCNGAYESMKWAGLLEDIDRFDASFWGIDQELARKMDPQLRLLLQSIWHGIEHAGYAAGTFTKQRVGVFIAADANEYASVLKANEQIPGLETGMPVGMLANKVSYYCNFQGPSESIDNACSSVYVALNQAQRAIQYGTCDVAVVAGVKLLLDAVAFMVRAEGQLLSASGTMYSFDKKADGYIRGEGVGCLVLKPLEQAKKDHDTIHAVIAGTGVAHNGNGALSSLAPSIEAQYKAIETAYRAAAIDPATVHYIEAHGTATDFNDAAEMAAYKRFFKAAVNTDIYKNHRCAVSTIKPNIGHLEAASGIASLLKAILALKHGKIPPVATFSSPHPSVFLEDSPFYIPTSAHSWESVKDAEATESLPRRAALHAVGIGGVNAHVLLEEHRTETPVKAAVTTDTKDSYKLLVISARSKRSLAEYTQQWLDYLGSIQNETEENLSSLANIAYSSQVSREAMRYRKAFVANDIESLKACLQKAIEGVERSQSGTCYFVSGKSNTVAKTPESSREFVDDGSLEYVSTVANAWVEGQSVDWERFSGDESLERITIPNYPFENASYWCGTAREDSFEKLFYETFNE